MQAKVYIRDERKVVGVIHYSHFCRSVDIHEHITDRTNEKQRIYIVRVNYIYINRTTKVTTLCDRELL